MTFDAHVDNAIRAVPGSGARIRTDVSTTLFLTPPEDYAGGELVIEDTYGTHAVKLPAGAMVVYPATSLHRVSSVTRGSRWASVFWTQSMVKDDGQHAKLYDLDMTIMQIRQRLPDDDHAVVALTSHYQSSAALGGGVVGAAARMSSDLTYHRLTTLGAAELRSVVRAAAEFGFTEAQLAWGQMLLDGKNCRRDPGAALRWFEIAAGAGSLDAVDMLGRLSRTGLGNPAGQAPG